MYSAREIFFGVGGEEEDKTTQIGFIVGVKEVGGVDDKVNFRGDNQVIIYFGDQTAML